MDEPISPGDSCVVQRDIEISGQVAFSKGEEVQVEAISPNPDMPEFKYLVFSHRMKTKFKLRARDITLIASPHSSPRNEYCPDCGYPLTAKGQCELCGEEKALQLETVIPNTQTEVATAGANAELSYRPYSYAIGVIELVVGTLYLTLIIIAFVRIGANVPGWFYLTVPGWFYLILILVITWLFLMIVGSIYAFARVGEHRALHVALGGILVLLSVLTINIGPFTLGASSWFTKLPLLLSGVAVIVLTRFVINRYRASHAPGGIKRKGRKKVLIVGAALLAGFIVLLVIMLAVYRGPAEERELLTRWEDEGFIRVFLKDDITVEERESMEAYIRNMDEVKSVKYISKEEALEEFRKMYEDQPEMLEKIEGNPFPAEFNLRLKGSVYVPQVTEKIETKPGISIDKFGKTEIRDQRSSVLIVSDYLHRETLKVRLSVIGGYVIISGLIILFTFLIFKRRRSSIQSIERHEETGGTTL